MLFGELRPDHPPVQMADGSLMESDDFFALQMRRAGNVIIAITPEVTPPDLFATNALALGDISTEKDSDGILRRVKAFRIYRHWNPAFKKVEADPDFGIDLARRGLNRVKIILPRTGRQMTSKFRLTPKPIFHSPISSVTNFRPASRRKRKPSPTNASGTWASSSPRRN